MLLRYRWENIEQSGHTRKSHRSNRLYILLLLSLIHLIIMETIAFRDDEGVGVDLPVYDGVPGLPGINLKTHIDEFNDMEYYDDDVCLISYAKSGTHWTHEILNMLLKKNTEYFNQGALLMENHKKEVHDKLQRPRVFNTHLRPRHLPKAMMDRRIRMVFVYRNPKDVAVSFFNFMKKLKPMNVKNMQWDPYFSKFMEGKIVGGSWLEYMMDWQKFWEENPDHPVVKVCYEDMKQDLRGNVQKIAEFLGTGTSVEDIETIAQKCQFDAMNASKQSSVPQDVKHISNDGSHVFYRKGEVGDWKNWFSVAQNEIFDSTVGKEIEKLKLSFRFV